jgi:predicted nucleotidyltransferase
MEKRDLLETLRQYKKNNEKKYGITKLGIFGSFARDESSTVSDVDIVLKTRTPDLFNIVHIKEDLEEQLCLPIDIVRLREKMNPFLRKRIDEEAIYV